MAELFQTSNDLKDCLSFSAITLCFVVNVLNNKTMRYSAQFHRIIVKCLRLSKYWTIIDGEQSHSSPNLLRARWIKRAVKL